MCVYGQDQPALTPVWLNGPVSSRSKMNEASGIRMPGVSGGRETK